MPDEGPNGWFQKHVMHSLAKLNDDVVLVRAHVEDVHQRINSIHASPCADIIRVKEDVGRLKTAVGLFKWLMGGLVISLLGLVVSLMILIRSAP